MMSKHSSVTIAVAMSGGVDSSVAALLLAQQGYQVIGITMKLWDFQEVGGNVQRESACCSIENMNDARSVCQELGIPHYVFDFRERFNHWVVDNFISEYKKGRTPNPCIICNTRIKWETLLQKAQTLGADYLATGHYAQVDYNYHNNRYILQKGVNREKDQSYALWGLTQYSLQHTVFPLGKLTKTEVRATARKLGLKTAGKAESQEICFVPDNDYRRLLQEKSGHQNSNGEGEIITTTGEVVGNHPGYVNFTIGQRHGLGVALGKPVYVVDIQPQSNRVVIGEKDELYRNGLVADQVNWIAVDGLSQPQRYFVKIRYKDPGSYANVFQENDQQIRVEFEQPQRAVTPGQSVVLYDEDVVIGGGIISESF